MSLDRYRYEAPLVGSAQRHNHVIPTNEQRYSFPPNLFVFDNLIFLNKYGLDTLKVENIKIIF